LDETSKWLDFDLNLIENITWIKCEEEYERNR
jgi:hypothetical protein